MSVMSLSAPVASLTNTSAAILSRAPADEVVEISLLLPAAWTDALIELSGKRDQTVGQILRSLIGRALCDGELSL
jgi:hypothetical protein